MTANADEVQSVDTLPHGEGPAAGRAATGGPAGGLVLGRYRLLERLGAGGFGVVWRAHDEHLDREVAVKRIVLAPGAVPGRVTREALASARLAHPAIVALYEAAAEEHAFCLVSELVRGSTLAQLIAGDELADADVLAIGLALCDALEHAHERGVIHRDVKPQNVLVPGPPGGHPVAAKLADFGGAWITGEDPLTRTGDVMGTLAYMAPEQAEGGDVGEGCDLYSCALVCYEALSGVNPVRGATPAATARNIGTELPSLREYRPDLPGELVAAIDVALDPEPEYRGDLADLREALVAAAQGPGRRRGWLGGWRRSSRRDAEEESWNDFDAGEAPTHIGAVTAPTQPTASHQTLAWPDVAWEGDEPQTLERHTREHPPAAQRTRRHASEVGDVRRPRSPTTAVDPGARVSERTSAPERGLATASLRPPARLLQGAGSGALASAALYGLGGATQQAALAAGLLTAVAVGLLPRAGWLAATLAVCAWLVAAGAPGSALFVAAAALPVPLLLRRPGPAWLAPALAPLLGLAGLAGAYPALAGQLGPWPRRAAAGALGYWWLVLAEPLLGRRLWIGPPVHVPLRAVWDGSITAAWTDALAPLLTLGVLLGACLWAAGAAVLPWIVRGRHAGIDVVVAVAWTVAIAASAPLVDRGALVPATGPAPRGLVLGAVLAGLLVVTARAARGAD